jgi:nitric oxide reductase large subunit
MPPKAAFSTQSEAAMTSTKKLWTVLGALLIVSFAVLLWTGEQIYQNAPPLPERVVAANGSTIFSRGDIEKGRQVWQSIGGMELGSIWGIGALALALFVAGLWLFPRREGEEIERVSEEREARRAP